MWINGKGLQEVGKIVSRETIEQTVNRWEACALSYAGNRKTWKRGKSNPTPERETTKRRGRKGRAENKIVSRETFERTVNR